MEVKRTLNPGEPGTLKLVQQYGRHLVCVRYRYDKTHHKRQTTVELIVDEKAWYGGKTPVIKPGPKSKAAAVYVKINYTELELRQLVKNAGAIWDKHKNLWQMSRKTAQELGLESRIVEIEDV